MPTLNLARLGVPVLLATLAATPASAQLFCPSELNLLATIPSVCGQIFANGIGNGVVTGTTGVGYLNSTGGSTGATVGTFGMLTSGSSAGTFGVLHASSTTSSAIPLPRNGTATEDDFLNDIARAAFADTGTLVGGGLPAGTLVTFEIHVHVDGVFGSGLSSGAGTIGFELFDSKRLVGFTPNEVTISDVNPAYDLVRDFTVPLGDSLSFFLRIDAGSGVDDFPLSYVPYSTSANLSNTGRLFIDVLTPGVALATGSGHDYATGAVVTSPVPEPGTLALMGAGLLATIAARRRRDRTPA